MNGIKRIIRQTDYQYTMIPNRAVRDPEITSNAFRLLAYLLSHENGYELKFAQIERQTDLGKYSLKAAIDLLIGKKYLRIERIRGRDGLYGSYDWILLDPYAIESTSGASIVDSIHTGSTSALKEDKEIQEDKRDKNIKEPLMRFIDFWDKYPRKRDRARALKAYKTAIRKADHETIMQGLQNYLAEVEGKDPMYIKYPASWLNAEAWSNEVSLTQEQINELEIRRLVDGE